MQEDRHIFIQPNQTVATSWIDINLCMLGSRVRMDVAAIERAFRRYLQAGDGQIWPVIVGHWVDPNNVIPATTDKYRRFSVDDGRHEYLALLALGREKVFVAWLETR